MICTKHLCGLIEEQPGSSAVYCPLCRAETFNYPLDGMVVLQAKLQKDKAIVALWNTFRDLSDHGEDALTESDLALWGYVTGHDAVQSRLK